MHKPSGFEDTLSYGAGGDSSSRNSNRLILPYPSPLIHISPSSTPSGPSNAKGQHAVAFSRSLSQPSLPDQNNTVNDDNIDPPLPPDYEPGHWDVICQRGKTCEEHIGNRRFRLCVENHVKAYMKARNRQAKSDVISAVVRSIRRATGKRGGFVMKVRIWDENT
jgi:hypothetical protein